MNKNARHNTFYHLLSNRITQLGGMHNAHLHLDRVGTIDARYWEQTPVDISNISCVPLLEKHGLISYLHDGLAYQTNDLKLRVNQCLDDMVAVNTVRADTFVDVTLDKVGLSAIKALHEIKIARSSDIDLRLGAYSPMGYTDDDPKRWELLTQALVYADFIGSLPEADDKKDYPAQIGFYENCKRMLQLAKEHSLEIHFHLDQRNEPSENGTEQLIDAIKEVGMPLSSNDAPTVWAVHVISPSTYEEGRFQRLVQKLADCNIGVISSPSAAIGMRQLRPLKTPTYNSIARLLEFLAAGIPVRIGSDNIADICSPSTTADLMDEVFVFSAALRFYHVDTLAKIATGLPLSSSEKDCVIQHLKANDAEINNTLANLRT